MYLLKSTSLPTFILAILIWVLSTFCYVFYLQSDISRNNVKSEYKTKHKRFLKCEKNELSQGKSFAILALI